MSVICARISGVLRSSCIYWAVKLNHEEHEGHGEFRIVLSLCRTLAIWGARAASPPCSAACRAQIPVGRRRCSVRVAHASRVLAMTSRHRGLLGEKIVSARRRKSEPDWRLHARLARSLETEAPPHEKQRLFPITL